MDKAKHDLTVDSFSDTPQFKSFRYARRLGSAMTIHAAHVRSIPPDPVKVTLAPHRVADRATAGFSGVPTSTQVPR